MINKALHTIHNQTQLSARSVPISLSSKTCGQPKFDFASLELGTRLRVVQGLDFASAPGFRLSVDPSTSSLSLESGFDFASSVFHGIDFASSASRMLSTFSQCNYATVPENLKSPYDI